MRRVVISPTIAVTTLAGVYGASGFVDGIGTNAMFKVPRGIAIDAASTIAIVVSVALRRVTVQG